MKFDLFIYLLKKGPENLELLIFRRQLGKTCKNIFGPNISTEPTATVFWQRRRELIRATASVVWAPIEWTLETFYFTPQLEELFFYKIDHRPQDWFLLILKSHAVERDLRTRLSSREQQRGGWRF